MEPAVLFDSGTQPGPRDEHNRIVALSVKRMTSINGLQRLTTLTLRAHGNGSPGAMLQQLNADGQSPSIVLYPDELRLLADEVEQWHRRYPDDGSIGR